MRRTRGRRCASRTRTRPSPRFIRISSGCRSAISRTSFCIRNMPRRSGSKRFLERELFAAQVLSEMNDSIPPLLDSGANYLVTPYYDVVPNRRLFNAFPIWAAKDALDVLKCLYEAGYSLIEFSPTAVLVTANKSIKVIDYEFLYRYENKPATFEQCTSGYSRTTSFV